jgi:DNA-binding Xre family transcriptional regulator
MAKRLKYNRIKTILADKGKTNQDLADNLGMSTFTVTKWNTNKGQPTIPDLYRIAEFLEVEVYDLLEKKPKLIEPPKRRTKKD